MGNPTIVEQSSRCGFRVASMASEQCGAGEPQGFAVSRITRETGAEGSTGSSGELESGPMVSSLVSILGGAPPLSYIGLCQAVSPDKFNLSSL